MRKRLTALLLLFLSFWQVASAAGLSAAWLDGGTALDHAAVHWQGEAHHHDDDGGVHADDSQDSIQHMMADCSFHHPAVLQAPAVVALESPPQHVAQTAHALPPAPYLDGLRRPPRLQS